VAVAMARARAVAVAVVLVLENIQKSRPPKMYQYIFPSYRDNSHKFQQNQVLMDMPNREPSNKPSNQANHEGNHEQQAPHVCHESHGAHHKSY
jgi:hypothetical protein